MSATTRGVRLFGIELTCRLQESWQLHGKFRHGVTHRVPHHLDIEFEVAMSNPVAHAPHRRPRNLRVGCDEARSTLGDSRRHFADQQQIQDDRLLGPLVALEGRAVESIDVAACIPRSFAHLLNPQGQTFRALHNGRASPMTCARIRAGRSRGVTTSTRTPSRSSSSTCRPPKSNRVVPGCGSTSKSRSLPSLSVPCSTEPNTRGLRTRKRATASRIDFSRCLRVSEGLMNHL